MPLSLGQIKVKAIVDWNVEWKKDCSHEKCEAHLKEIPKNPIRRGMIVRVEGDPQQEQVEGIWATFGDDIGKDQFELGDIKVPCIKIQARELNLVADAGTKMASEAWKRTFNIPDVVGTIFQSRTAKGRKTPIVDKLQLTGSPTQGPISDGPSAVKGEDD